MTRSIDRTTRDRVSAPPIPDETTFSRPRLVIVIRCLTGTLTLIAGGFLIAAFTFAGWRSALAAATFFILAVLGAVVLTIEALLADRQEFYRRGELDGWIKGWRGQIPETDDPLLR